MHVETAAEGVVYEVIAVPQEQPDQAQEERCEHPAQGPSDLRPRCITFISNYATIYIYFLCIKVYELNGTLDA